MSRGLYCIWVCGAVRGEILAFARGLPSKASAEVGQEEKAESKSAYFAASISACARAFSSFCSSFPRTCDLINGFFECVDAFLLGGFCDAVFLVHGFLTVFRGFSTSFGEHWAC